MISKPLYLFISLLFSTLVFTELTHHGHEYFSFAEVFGFYGIVGFGSLLVFMTLAYIIKLLLCRNGNDYD